MASTRMIRCHVAKSSVDQDIGSCGFLELGEESSGSLLDSVEGKVWLMSGSYEESESDDSVSEILGFVCRLELEFGSGDDVVFGLVM